MSTADYSGCICILSYFRLLVSIVMYCNTELNVIDMFYILWVTTPFWIRCTKINRFYVNWQGFHQIHIYVFLGLQDLTFRISCDGVDMQRLGNEV